MDVYAQHSEMDYAILHCDTEHAYLPIYDIYEKPPEQLLGVDPVLAGDSIGTGEQGANVQQEASFN